jgi:hypothetical protein
VGRVMYPLPPTLGPGLNDLEPRRDYPLPPAPFGGGVGGPSGGLVPPPTVGGP